VAHETISILVSTAADTAALNKEYNKVSNKIAKPTAFYPPLPANGTFSHYSQIEGIISPVRLKELFLPLLLERTGVRLATSFAVTSHQ
jgi:hypothetical protein